MGEDTFPATDGSLVIPQPQEEAASHGLVCALRKIDGLDSVSVGGVGHQFDLFTGFAGQGVGELLVNGAKGSARNAPRARIPRSWIA